MLVLHLGDRPAGTELNQHRAPEIHEARLDELAPRTLLGILAVRQDVFVVEQNCVYADIDDRDADAVHLWIEDDGGRVVSTLRLLDEGKAGHRIGRVATLPAFRGRGYSGLLLNRAIELSQSSIALSAQAYLIDWYARFGFEVCGERWIEDGIEHAPMRREIS